MTETTAPTIRPWQRILITCASTWGATLGTIINQVMTAFFLGFGATLGILAALGIFLGYVASS